MNWSTKYGPLGSRADERHVAPQHVPELRQFIDARPAEQAAHRRASRVVVSRPDRTGLGFGVLVHRAELVDGELLAVQAHPLLPVEDRPRRRAADDERRDGERDREQHEGGAGHRDVERPLDEAVEALERNVVDVDDRDAVEILEARAQRDHLEDVRHDLDVDHLAADHLQQLQHLHVLFGGQRDVEMVDMLANGDLAGFVERAENRQAAVPQIIAARTIVHEPDHVIAELAVLEDAIGDQPSELARAGNQNPLEADAGAPPPLERLAHQLARGERQAGR